MDISKLLPDINAKLLKFFLILTYHILKLDDDIDSYHGCVRS